MLEYWIKKVCKEVLPGSVYSWLRSVYREIGNCVKNLRQNIISRYINNWAAKQVLKSIIIKTDDAKTVTWLGQPIWQYPQDAWNTGSYWSI